MKCEKCGCDIPEDEDFEHLGQTVCEDCYIDAMSPSKPCDPWAVHLASRAIHTDGVPQTDQLTEPQNAILKFIDDNGKVTLDQIREKFNLKESELESQIATLRHCDLLNGRKEDGVIYFFGRDQMTGD